MPFSRPRRWRRLTAGGIGATVAGATLALVAVPVSASPDPRSAALFELLDANRGGSVSLVEFQTSMASAPPLGAIAIIVDTKAPPFVDQPRGELFKRLDDNRDGTLSLAEFDANVVVRTVASAAISEADANKDGSLTEGELASYFATQSSAKGTDALRASAALMARGIISERDDDGDGNVALAALQR